MATEDLNADGRLDLVVANGGSNTVSVLLGNGDGTCGIRTDFETGTGPRSVAIGDLNADGRPDLAVANQGSNALSVLLGNGDGTFGGRTDFETGSGPVSVAIQDLSGDGKPDLVAANAGSNTLSVLLGTGDGSFGAKADFETGNGPGSVAVADLNADGHLDLVAGGATLSTLLGNGDGSFGTESELGIASNSVAIADLNADGKLDLVIALIWAAVEVMIGNGDGTFDAQAELRTTAAASIAIGDLNADGKPDLALACYGYSYSGLHENYLLVHLGNGDGTFGARAVFETGARPISVAVGDLNGDGKPDLAAANRTDLSEANGPGTVSVLLGGGDGTFGFKRDFETGNSPASVAIGELNGGGGLDLAVANHDEANTVSVLIGNGDGTFGAKTDLPAGSFPISIAVGDLNGDARTDLVVGNEGGTVSVILGNGNGTFGAKTDLATGGPAQSVIIWDVNADQKPDLVTANRVASTISVFLGNGDGTFGVRSDFWVGGWPHSIAIADLNGDARPDIAVTDALNYAGGASSDRVSILLGRGDGTFGAAADFGTGKIPTSVAIGDLNADGKPDLAVASNTLDVLLGNGDGTFGARSAVGTWVNPNPLFVAIADLNADGKLDLAAANLLLPHSVSVLLGNGDGTFGVKMDYGVGGPLDGVDGPNYVAIGDLNSDGRPDLAVTNAGRGTPGCSGTACISTVSVLLNIGSQPTEELQVSVNFAPDVINLTNHARWLTAYIEPSGFDPSTIDVSTLRLAGTVPPAPKFAVVRDHNSNGTPEIMVKFGRETLDPFLAPGVHELVLAGSLVTGEHFRGSALVQVSDGPDGPPLSASVAPNPLNPIGTMRFATSMPGRVKIMLFDIEGRLVRILMDTTMLEAGPHETLIDGRDTQGRTLATGMYFYRLDTSSGSVTGRFAVLK